MKTIVKKEVKQYVDEEIEIKGATLLSIEEAEQLPLDLRKYNDWWWIRSPGSNSDHAAFVDYVGSVSHYGNLVCDIGNSVRPALKLSNLYASNLQIGDVFEFGGKPFKIVSDKLAFCLTDIGRHCFRKDWEAEDSNDYEKSDVKKHVDNWFRNVSA